MRTTRWTIVLPLLAIVLTGCSRSGAKEAVNASGVSSVGLTSTLPSLPSSGDRSAVGKAATEKGGRESERFIPPFPENVDLFSPPKVVVPVVTREEEPRPEPQKEPAAKPPAEKTPQPPLRLLGFVDVEGLKALLSVDGKLAVTTIGDSISGVEIIAVEPPAVVLRHGGEEFEMNLFEQEWFHQPHITAPILGPGKTVGGKTVYQRDPAYPSLSGTGKNIPALPKLPTSDGAQHGSPLPGLPALRQGGAVTLPELPGTAGTAADEVVLGLP